MFLREAANTRVLNHKNIVEFRSFGSASGVFFFTVEFCNGGSVEQRMRQRGGTLPLDEAMSVTLQCLDGLQYAHTAEIPYVKLKDGGVGRGRGLVHRDLTPHNILLKGTESSPIAKIGDFGLSKAFDQAGLSGLTRTGTTAGKPYFMCRQQVIDYKCSQPAVDIWAMAATLYNMLTGSHPRDFPRGKDVWATVLEAQPVRIRERQSEVPKRLADVIDAALADRKELCFARATDFQTALKDAL